MNASIDKYVDLISRYAIYGENGYYIDSHIIHRIIVDELKLSMSFKDIVEFVKNCEMSLTTDNIYRGIYTNINFKTECETLLNILDDLAKIKEGTISDESWRSIINLGFHINQYGDIYYSDAVRLADTIIYNVKHLFVKINQDNNIDKDGMLKEECYAKREIQGEVSISKILK